MLYFKLGRKDFVRRYCFSAKRAAAFCFVFVQVAPKAVFHSVFRVVCNLQFLQYFADFFVFFFIF